MWLIYVHIIGVQTPTWHRKCDSCLRIDQLAEKGNGSQKRSELETEAQIFGVSSLKAEAVWSCSVVRTFCIGLYRVPRDPSENLPDDVKKAVDALNADIGDSTLGPDFRRDGLQATTHDWRSARLRT